MGLTEAHRPRAPFYGASEIPKRRSASVSTSRLSPSLLLKYKCSFVIEKSPKDEIACSCIYQKLIS